ncbi:MAG TPA: hypothetical protein VHM23_26220, partial [Actinomycetota bacterium]|nr:hypothetical protein [Actinomycetota bacterium]
MAVLRSLAVAVAMVRLAGEVGRLRRPGLAAAATLLVVGIDLAYGWAWATTTTTTGPTCWPPSPAA